MKIIDIAKKELNEFVSARSRARFLESWEWGEFQEAAGNKTFRFGFEDSGQLFFAGSLIKKSLPLGMNYFYAPQVNFENLNAEQLKFVFDSIKKIAGKEKAIFLRFEPIDDIVTRYALRITRTIDIQPPRTLILDLRKTEDELLNAMHQKTRYNIRLAEKKGVVIREAGENDFEKFWKLMDETKDRDGFRLHNQEYYGKMLSFLNGERETEKQTLKIKLFLAEYESRIIAGNIIAFFGDTATYMHGASSNEYRNVMAPYLLQWQIIKIAKDSGYKYYDFYGVDEKKWPGVTRFKIGFGGKEVNYPGTFDLVFNRAWYNLYKLLRRIRRMV